MATRDLNATVIAALDDDVVTPFFAIELLFDSPNELRLWTGYGDLSYDGNTWFGTGDILAVDVVEETAEMDVKGATLTLSGVPSNVLSLALSEPYQGRVCNILFGVDDTNLVTIFSGYMDQMNIDEGADSCVISLTVENKLIDLERPRVSRYTSEYQKSVYAGDLGFDFIADLQDKEIYWGRKGAR